MSLPLTTVKFHQLQVFRGTPMAAEYDADPAQVPFLGGRPVHRPVRRDTAAAEARPGRRTLCFSEAPPRYHYGRNWGLIRNEAAAGRCSKKDWRSANAYQGEIFIPLWHRIVKLRVGYENASLWRPLLKSVKEYFLMTVGMMLYSFGMDRMHHARRRYRRRCHGPFARAVPCAWNIGPA